MVSPILAAVLALVAGFATATETTPVATLIENGAGEKDRFGNTVVMSPRGLAVSSLFAWNKNGEVMFYHVDEHGYTQMRSIVGHVPFGAFGHSIAWGNHYLAIGSPAEICYNYKGDRYSDCGVVYVYSTNLTSPDREVYPTKLMPKEKDHISSAFGTSVATNGETLFVGAPGVDGKDGSVMLYEHSDKGWELDYELKPRSEGYGGGFGTTMALNRQDTVLVVGAPNDICTLNGFLHSGAVHLFHKGGSATQWVFEQTLFPTLPVGDMQFGSAVAISSYEIVVGSSQAHGAHDSNTGAAFVFNLVTQTSFSQNAQLLASDGVSGDGFGCSVAVDDAAVVVGACYESGKMSSSGQPLQVSDGALCGPRSTSDSVCYQDTVLSLGENAGAVYVYRLLSGSDERFSDEDVTKVLAPNGEDGWLFGSSVAAYNGRIVVGAHGAASESTPQTGGIFDISFVAVSPVSSFVASVSSASTSELMKGFAYLLLGAACVGIVVVIVVPMARAALRKSTPAGEWSPKGEQPMTMRRSSPSEHGLLAASEHGSDVSTRGLQGKTLFPGGDVESPSPSRSVGVPSIGVAPVAGRVEQYGTSFSQFGVVNASSVPSSANAPGPAADWGVEEYKIDNPPRKNIFKVVMGLFS